MEDTVEDSYDYLFKLLCIGETNVGKTTFLHQYIHDTFANFRSTIGVDIFKKYLTTKDNQRILLQLWDTAGQVRMHRSSCSTIARGSLLLGTLSQFDQVSLP